MKVLSKKSVAICMSLALFCSFSKGAQALEAKQPKSVTPKDKEVVIGFFDNNYVPYIEVVDEAKKQYEGISMRALSFAFKNMGYKIKTVNVMNMKRMVNSLGTGEVHICPNLTPTKERLEVALFTNTPQIDETHELVVRASDVEKIKFDGNIPKLSQYTFGSLCGWTHGHEFDTLIKDKKLKNECRINVEAQLDSLINGRFDIAVSNGPNISWWAKKKGQSDKIKVLSPIMFNLPTPMAVSKAWDKDGSFTKQLEEEIVKYLKTSQYRKDLEDLNLAYVMDAMKSPDYHNVVEKFQVEGFTYRMKVPVFE